MMNIQITFRGEHEESPVIREHIYKGLERVEKLVAKEPSPIFVEVVIEPHFTHHHHKIEIRFKSPHYEIFMHDEGPELYVMLDALLRGLYDRICQQKERVVDHRQKK